MIKKKNKKELPIISLNKEEREEVWDDFFIKEEGIVLEFDPDSNAGEIKSLSDDGVDTHGQARGTLTECKLRLTGFAGRPSLRSGTHSPTGKPVEPCGRMDGRKLLRTRTDVKPGYKVLFASIKDASGAHYARVIRIIQPRS